MRILVTGVTGQDGSYMAELHTLLDDEVYGLVRRSASPNLWRIQHLLDTPNFKIVYGDLTDLPSLIKAVTEIKPHKIYNLAAQSFVGVSWRQPIQTINATGIGAVNVFEAVRLTGVEARIFQASSSEMFGKAYRKPMNEKLPMHARSPYGVAKILAHKSAELYRDQGLFISCGISFNHESSRRGTEFVTRKITWQGSRVAKELQDEVVLGDVSAQRDWGYTPDYVYGFHQALQYNEPFDFVFATGEVHSVKDICDVVQSELGDKFQWSSSKSECRPTELYYLCGDYTKAKQALGWHPTVHFESLIKQMLQSDMLREREDQLMDPWEMRRYIT